ncbi:MAG TPA: hypothetical protein PKC86_00790 [Candidatus Saccharibacteria bacterium]|nr:hypothetical protein [Candidatus Saccharibacteria bacterium]HRN90295.1 hypothetical protein [Candidatus Saccharibacteria bacterium]HRN97252.1 hypothetical protein [Candidatus Saccharibacteria bacterium]HRQ06604.1 hypothetical protein [Candidatus Saccharibacteria bacterium]
MALFIRQDEQRSKIQDRITAELQEKARQKALETERPDGVKDSAYIKNTQSTTNFAWIWIIIGVIAVGIIIWLTILSVQG